MKKYNDVYCIECEKIIEKKKNASIKTYYQRKYCSQNCLNKHKIKTKSKIIQCDFCKKEISRQIKKIRKTNFCSAKCNHKYLSLIGLVEQKCDFCGNVFFKKKSECKTKRNFCNRQCMGKWQSVFKIGEEANSWQGGKATLYHSVRSLEKSKRWRTEVFKRDNFTCQKCGDKTGGNLNAHHIKAFSDILKNNDIKDIFEANDCYELWDINNGITLCSDCHRNEHTK